MLSKLAATASRDSRWPQPLEKRADFAPLGGVADLGESCGRAPAVQITEV
jgi:hypothetical protein